LKYTIVSSNRQVSTIAENKYFGEIAVFSSNKMVGASQGVIDEKKVKDFLLLRLILIDFTIIYGLRNIYKCAQDTEERP